MGTYECLYEMRASWQTLCAITSVQFLMLEDSDLVNNFILVSFRGQRTTDDGDHNGDNRRAILIDWEKDCVSIVSFGACVSGFSY